MGSFNGRLTLDFGDWQQAGRIAITLNDIVWDDGEGVFCVIPSGTMSDGASVPWFLWWFLPPWGDRATIAAILHDYLCEQKDKKTPIVGCERRVDCDNQYKKAVKVLGVKPFKAWVAWIGVRAYSIFYAGLIQHIE